MERDVYRKNSITATNSLIQVIFLVYQIDVHERLPSLYNETKVELVDFKD